MNNLWMNYYLNQFKLIPTMAAAPSDPMATEEYDIVD